MSKTSKKVKIKKVENQKNPQLFFISYHIHCDIETMKHCEFLSTRCVRRLNITHSQLCEELKFIEDWKHLKNSNGTQCIGDNLTILPSETMDMKMDVSDLVEIENNYLTLNDKPMTIQKYLYGGGYINVCWEFTQVKKHIELGIDVDNHPYFKNYSEDDKKKFIKREKNLNKNKVVV